MRKSVSLLFLGMLLAGSVRAQISGWVLIEIVTPPTVSSEGYGIYPDRLGDPARHAYLTGHHRIYDANSLVDLKWHFIVATVPAEYRNTISAAGTECRYYRANLYLVARDNDDGRLLDSNEYTGGAKQVPCPPPPPDPPPPEQQYEGAPLILDLDNNGFHLAGRENAIRFDLNADGEAELTTWTAAGEEDSLLSLDLNGNGTIDDGRELFNNRTSMPWGGGSSGPGGHGFGPLSDYDLAQLGGNQNMFIDPGDSVFSRLRAWVDRNHNGISESGELLTMEQAGVLRLEYDYTRSERRDPHGNFFRFKGRGWKRNPDGAPRAIQVYDVFFIRVP